LVIIFKELKIFLFIFIVLSLLMHYKEFFSSPIQHILNLPKSGAFGFGVLHPLIFAFLLYIVVLVFSLTLKLIMNKK